MLNLGRELNKSAQLMETCLIEAVECLKDTKNTCHGRKRSEGGGV